MGTSEHPQVLIVGAGPVGLGAAIELGSRGIRCLVVERNDRVGYAPRAKTTNIRTREHLRRWGIAGKLREASPLGVDYPSDVAFVTRLDSYELARFENAFFCDPVRDDRYAEHSQWIPQYIVEKVLRDHAETLPTVSLRFSCQLESLTQDAHGVSATVRDLVKDATDTVRCDYLIGADGSRSTVREAIGAVMYGKSGLSRNYNMVFRAPGLLEMQPHAKAIMYWPCNAMLPGLMGPMDRGDTWFFMPMHVPGGMTFDDFRNPATLHRATGIATDYEILSSDEWIAHRLIADRYRDRRVFLAGDACHLHPPFGGYGMNMGVADAVDLGWKIAAVLQGWGGPALLDSYEPERRPVHQMVMDEAEANHSVLGNALWAEGYDTDTSHGAALRGEIGARIHREKEREFRALGVVIGYRYGASPVIVDDDLGAPAFDPMGYTPSNAPGRRAPHVWLEDGRSLYDLFGLGFAVIAHPSAQRAALALADAAAASGVPMAVIAAETPELSALYPTPLTLVRTDQHVAWRGMADELHPIKLMSIVTGRSERATSADSYRSSAATAS